RAQGACAAPRAHSGRRRAQCGLDQDPGPRPGRTGAGRGPDGGSLWRGPSRTAWRRAGMSPKGARPPVYVEGLSAIAAHFDHVLLDQWGVLHDGRRVLPGVPAAVAGLRAGAKTILVLSNSGKRAADNVERLAALGLPRGSLDFVMTSGEATWRALQRAESGPFGKLGRRCLLIARGGDRSIVHGLDLDLVEQAGTADFILLAGLDDGFSDPALWPAILDEAARRGLPMICANPDLTMFTPG